MEFNQAVLLLFVKLCLWQMAHQLCQKSQSGKDIVFYMGEYNSLLNIPMKYQIFI